MKLTIFTLVIFICVGLIQSQSIHQSKLYTSERNNTYYIEHKQRYGWFNALANCIRMKMFLLTIDSEEKSNEVNKLVKDTFGKNIILWAGGFLTSPGKHFAWIWSGEQFTYTHWWTGQPDFSESTEYCLQIGYGENMEWNDNSCNLKFGYICEYPQPKNEASKSKNNTSQCV